MAHYDRPPFSGRPSLTGHCGHAWTCSLPRIVGVSGDVWGRTRLTTQIFFGGAADPTEFFGSVRVCPWRYLHAGLSGPIEGGEWHPRPRH